MVDIIIEKINIKNKKQENIKNLRKLINRKKIIQNLRKIRKVIKLKNQKKIYKLTT